MRKLKKFIKILKNERLSDSEKNALKTEIFSFVKNNPVRVESRARQQLSEGRGFPFSLLISKPMLASFVLIALITFGGGVSYAAETSLPGDMLYPVKVNVNEKVRGTLAISGDAEAKYQARLAEKRLAEAGQLAAQAELNANLSSELETAIDAHVSKTLELANQLSQDGNDDTAIAISSQLEAALKTYAHVLVDLNSRMGDRESQLGTAEKIAVAARTSAQFRADVESRMASNVDVETSAKNKAKAAQNKIDSTSRFLERQKTKLSANAYASSTAMLNLAENFVAQGRVDLESQAYGQAFVKFQEAIRAATAAKLFANITKYVHTDIAFNIPAIGSQASTTVELSEQVDLSAENETSGSVDVVSGGDTDPVVEKPQMPSRVEQIKMLLRQTEQIHTPVISLPEAEPETNSEGELNQEEASGDSTEAQASVDANVNTSVEIEDDETEDSLDIRLNERLDARIGL